jgi:hypothetical protein
MRRTARSSANSSLTALVACLALAATASAQERVMVVGFDANGDPLLNAHVEPTARGSVTEWRRCAPGGSPCVPLPQGAYDAAATNARLDRTTGRRPAAPGETPAGTTFEAAFVVDGVPSTVRTQPWTGRMTIAALPGAGSDLKVGALRTWQEATIAGGWNPAPPVTPYYGSTGDYYVCPLPTGGDCMRVGTRRMRARYAGWYVFTTHMRSWIDPGVPIAIPSVALAGDGPVHLTLSPTGQVSGLSSTSAALGPICCVGVTTIEPPVTPPAAPKATIKSRARSRNGWTVVGSVTCAQRCRVMLTVRGGGKRVVRRSFSGQGKRSLSVPRRRGRLRVSVLVDARPVAAGTTEAR